MSTGRFSWLIFKKHHSSGKPERKGHMKLEHHHTHQHISNTGCKQREDSRDCVGLNFASDVPWLSVVFLLTAERRAAVVTLPMLPSGQTKAQKCLGVFVIYKHPTASISKKQKHI